MDWVGLVIQALLLGGLIWYSIETRRIRIVSTAQLEALQAPCLTLVATLREGSEAVLDTAGARGTLVLDFNEGFFLAGIVAHYLREMRTLHT